MEFMLVLYEDPDLVATDEQHKEAVERVGEYAMGLLSEGALKGGAPLHPVTEARRIRIRDGERRVLDGPFAESKEVIAGYFVIEAPGRDAAVAIASRCPNAEFGEGAAYRQVLAGPGGRRIDGDYRITAFDPPRRLEFLVTAGPARPRGVFELADSAGRGTVVRFTLDLRPAGLMKLMTPMIARQMRREVAQLETLKKVLEQAVPR